MSDSNAVDVVDLDFSYAKLHGLDPVPVLEGVNLTLERGSRCLIIGANGAGALTFSHWSRLCVDRPAGTAGGMGKQHLDAHRLVDRSPSSRCSCPQQDPAAHELDLGS